MKKRGNAKVVIGIVVVIAIALIAMNGFKQPNIIRLSETDAKISCPKAIDGGFELDYRNDGTNPLTICVDVSSDDISFDTKTQCTTILSRKTGTVKFSIDESSLPAKSETAEIKVVYSDYYQGGDTLTSAECSYMKVKNTDEISFTKSKHIY